MACIVTNTDTGEPLIGFEPCTTVFSSDGSTITQTYSNRIKTTTFNSNGSITETLKASASSSPYITKNTVFNSDGSISETVSYA